MESFRLRLGFALALLLSAPAARAGSFRTLAKELSVPAKKAGIQRLAVLPFESAQAPASEEGLRLSQELLTQLVRAGQVQVVDRSFFKEIMDEHGLARTGLLEQASLKKLGKLLSADALVTGSVTTQNGRATVNARLIEVETGLVLAAGELRLKRGGAVPAPVRRRPAVDISPLVAAGIVRL